MKKALSIPFTRRFLLPATACVCLFSPISQAASGNLSVGMEAGYTGAEYKDVDTEASAMPFIEYEIGRFSFYALGASARLATFTSSPETDIDTGAQDSPYKLHFLASVNFANGERDNDDSPVFFNMETREMGSSAGITSLLETPFGLFSASYLSDVSDASNGSFTSLAYGFPLYGNGKVFVGGNIGIAILDENWNDYYYGVRESEATGSRAAYQASTSVSPFLELSAMYAFSQHWILSQEVTITKLDDTVVDSPLTVDDGAQSEFLLSLRYSF